MIKFQVWLLALILCGVLLFAPIVPSTIFFHYWPVSVGAEFDETVLSPSEFRAAIKQLRQHGHFGKGEFRTVPPAISVYDYLFVYRRIGILSVEPLFVPQQAADDLLVLRARIGFDCGDFCGGAAIFELSKSNGEWEVSEVVGYSVD